jgi:hypothetical protein
MNGLPSSQKVIVHKLAKELTSGGGKALAVTTDVTQARSGQEAR